MTLYAVDCSNDELAEVEAVSAADIRRLGAALQIYTGTRQQPPGLRVLCFGRSANYANSPSDLKRSLDPWFGCGAWIRKMRAAIVLFDERVPVWCIVVHEVTHALLDLLTGGFPYPIAIEEGFARAMEYLLPNSNMGEGLRRRLVERNLREQRYLDPDECMSVKQLLFFDPKEYWKKDPAAFARMTYLSFWLNVYLAKLSRQRPILKPMLYELRMNNISTPQGVYDWLIGASGMRIRDFEIGFRRFCTTGIIPDL